MPPDCACQDAPQKLGQESCSVMAGLHERAQWAVPRAAAPLPLQRASLHQRPPPAAHPVQPAPALRGPSRYVRRRRGRCRSARQDPPWAETHAPPIFILFARIYLSAGAWAGTKHEGSVARASAMGAPEPRTPTSCCPPCTPPAPWTVNTHTHTPCPPWPHPAHPAPLVPCVQRRRGRCRWAPPAA